MRFNTRLLFLPVLFVLSSVFAQQTGEPTSATPSVTYPAGDAFVFCSDQDCAGTCQLVSGNTLLFQEDTGEYLPNDMGFLSIYWHDPDNEPWTLTTAVNYYGSEQSVFINPNTCYNLYDNSVPAYFYYYRY
ncbi:hypothetical protein J3R83DRAFT_11457, partial [Lanmaoa asiatica]